MKKNNRSITKILLNSKYVNNFTKLLLILNRLDYYEDYYIPNKKLENLMKIRKHRIIGLLKQLEEENIIRILYKGRRRYFLFTDKDMAFSDDLKKEAKKPELFDYNWLEDEEN